MTRHTPSNKHGDNHEIDVDRAMTNEAAHQHTEDDEVDALYGNMEDLKKLITGEDNHESGGDDANEQLDIEFSSDNESDISERDDALLAEFSDYGEVSEDDEENFMDAIREANNFKVRRKTKDKKSHKKDKKPKTGGRGRPRVVDPEVAQLLSEANEAFVRNDLIVAERLYNEVIKKDARNFAAYETLGDIYQLQGRLNDCCNSWFLAAHINSTDWEFWKVVAILSSELDHIRQAIYCFSRVIHLNGEEWESLYRRSLLYKKIGQIGRALEGFQKLYQYNPFDGNILRELAVLYVDYNRLDDAIDLYMKIFESNVERRNAIISASENAVESSDEGSQDEDKENDEEDNEYLDEMIESNEKKQLYPNVNWKRINSKYRCLPFDWSSLNILTELFLKLPIGGNSGISTIKRCARWIEYRELQTYWDDMNDDSEFDDRRFKNGKFDAQSVIEQNKASL